MLTDIEIARQANSKPIRDIASDKLGVAEKHLNPYGHDKAKIDLNYLESLPENSNSKLILVTAISPTPSGEGKTTTTVGLGDGLNRIGKKTIICLREPSLGPCFGVKGGAAGGGMAQVIPMEDINLHFTGDFHAITAAHNLLAAVLDNHIHWSNTLDFDTRRIQWRRVLDMNDRALRNTIIALGGKANGHPRESGFDITVASEIMAILCLASSRADLEHRLGEICVGFNTKGEPVKARQLGVTGSLNVLLKDAIEPNLVQTLENNPAFIHGGPFANIAHGCNSLIATRSALKLADYVVTEAGFGADLGAEKFFDIKCRAGNLTPSAVVIVATVKSLKMHGGVPKDQLAGPNVASVEKGLENLGRHIENTQKFGLPVVVALNAFASDTDEEMECIRSFTTGTWNVPTIISNHWANGSAGITDLAECVVDLCDQPSTFTSLYDHQLLSLFGKINHIAKTLYGAGGASAPSAVHSQLEAWEKQGYGELPICMAKTPYSFSTDHHLMGAPSGHEIGVNEVRLAAGAGFIVAICGAVMTMPGLPRNPAAENIYFDHHQNIQGLF